VRGDIRQRTRGTRDTGDTGDTGDARDTRDRSLAIAYIFSLGASREPRAVGGETAPARRARALAACTHAHARESRLWEASSDTQQIETDLPKPLKSWRYTQILLATYSHAWRGAPWKCDRRKRRSWSQHMDAKTRRRERIFFLGITIKVRANLSMHARTPIDSACTCIVRATLWLRARAASLSGTHQPSPDTTVTEKGGCRECST